MAGTEVTRLIAPAAPRGSKVAVVSPGSYPQEETLRAGVERLAALGFVPSIGRHARSKAHGFFAGSESERLEDLHAAFADAEVRAIFCSRGGYGSNYLLRGLDLELIARNPKPLLGYSDLTCVQTWLLDRAGLIAFHGPMAAADFSAPEGVETESLLAALQGDAWSLGPESGLRALQPGRAAGVLYGGCLTVLAASLGTPYAPQMAGKLLFLEDVGLKPYQFDRLLRQMLLAGCFEETSGIVFGEMLHCIPEGRPPEYLDDIVRRVLRGFRGPIAMGLRSGHVSRRNATLAFGVRAALDLEGEPVLTFLERATHPARG
jgi:muramoyltetrapeptide carboxypeptidase